MIVPVREQALGTGHPLLSSPFRFHLREYQDPSNSAIRK
jgi:hypothetical protein